MTPIGGEHRIFLFMKRFSSILELTILLATALAPQQAYAAWEWVPKVWKFENPYRGLDASRYPGFECKLRNSWGDCVVLSFVAQNKPDKQKNYYRRVSSYGIESLNYSDCQYDDYRRETSQHTYYTNCDYGEPRSGESR